MVREDIILFITMWTIPLGYDFRVWLIRLLLICKHRILRLEEVGVLNIIFKKTVLATPIEEGISAYSSAGKEHVGSAVLLFLSGLVSAIVFLLLELAFASYKAWQLNK